jgi:hypothetical protein
VNDLPAVAVTVTASAFDAQSVLLASGSKTVNVINDTTTTATVTLSVVQADVEQEIAVALQLLIEAKDSTAPATVKSKAESAMTHLTRALTSATPDSDGFYRANFYYVLARLEAAAATVAMDWGVTLDTNAAAMQSPARMVGPDPYAVGMTAVQSSRLSMAVRQVNSQTFLESLLQFRDFTVPENQQVNGTPTTVQYTKIVNGLKTLITGLTEADAKLIVLENSAMTTLTLTSPLTPEAYAATTVDKGDLHLLRAVFNLLIGSLNHAIAYNLDSAGWNWDQDFHLYDTNHNGTVTTNEYLPAAPFGTLNSDGVTRMNNALQAYRTCLNEVDQGLTYHLQSGKLDAPGELFAEANPQDLAQLRDIARRLKTTFVGSDILSPWMTGLKQDLNVNLPSGFTSPVQNLRTLLPDFTITPIGDPVFDYDSEAIISTIDDKTFGGLFPNGLPNDLFDEATLFGTLDITVN